MTIILAHIVHYLESFYGTKNDICTAARKTVHINTSLSQGFSFIFFLKIVFEFVKYVSSDISYDWGIL